MLKVAWSDIYLLDLPAEHRFPMDKYPLLREQLLYEGTLVEDNFFQPQPLEEKYILNTHQLAYWQKLRDLTISPAEMRPVGFPLTKQLIEREITIAQGTIECAKFALQQGVAMNIAGGTHHAFTDRGEGFCLLNDLAIASNYLLEKQLAKKILIVDLDVHQGNGTAEVCRENAQVFTFSMHGEKNYPRIKEKSDLDCGLPDEANDAMYLGILRETLPALIDSVEPDFIFYQSGVDVLATDKLGRLSLSREGCKERDRIVLQACKTNKIPVAISMGGGYSPRLVDIVEAHANTFRLAQDIFF
jgi:acetoin utilization deacetylase AcuC-like enzyme